ncbi:MAG TPA: hypothetical protein VGM02_12820 [Acidobacteriaceae bacterium]|jgi:hypothetical protein
MASPSLASTIDTPSSPRSIFEPTNAGSSEQFKASFDEKPFEFHHGLTESHPLFTLPAMRRLLDEPAVKDTIAYDAGNIRVDQSWTEIVKQSKPPIEEVFDNLATSSGWIVIRHVDRVPEYKAILNDCLAEVCKLSGRDLNEDAKSREAMIFVTSPNRVTPYHIDRECNFLMQVKGDKIINVFDRNDKEVVTDKELEIFWSKDNTAGFYKPEFQHRAFVTTMRPGTGVHIPVNFPHWLQNLDNVSISFSISYQYKDWKRKNVYQANYYLRKMGMNPTPPGQSAVLDYTKRVVIEAVLRTKRLIKPKK